MRLLNVKTLQLEQFTWEVGDGIPEYAILSHTWGVEEVSYSDYINQQCLSKKGYEKILGCCRLAESEGFLYVWIDTCCIDKSSSVELSESINSMFQWYRDSRICYAYLSDVNSSEDPSSIGSSFTQSLWFTRGWTLQELLAPAEVVFLGSDWIEIGTKSSLCSNVSRITRISKNALEECSWNEYSVAQKMSWAAGRQTRRLEDKAYCLMGLFDVNMPLLYGEGWKAFTRLQQEILKQSDDQSIFAWSYGEELHSHVQLSGLVATSPEDFKDASRVELLGPEFGEVYENPFQLENRLVRLRLRLVDRIRAMRLQRVLREPLLYNVVEIEQGGDGSKRRLSTTSSPPGPPREAIIDVEVQKAETQQHSPTPVIAIEVVDTSSEPAGARAEASRSPDKTMRDKVLAKLSEADTPLSDSESDVGVLGPDPVESIGVETWRWYIYEPAIIVPLRCHIGGRQLGILLSKGSIKTAGKVLSRLHNPSIIAIEGLREAKLTPLTTVYANTSTRSDQKSAERWGSNCCLEIRIASLLSAGYMVHGDCGPGWTYIPSRSTLVEKRNAQYEDDYFTITPFILFYRMPNNSSPVVDAFVLSIPTCKNNSLKCEIDVIMNVPTSIVARDYDPYSFHLGREPRAQIPCGDGKAIVVKYRQGSKLVNLSIEPLNMEKAAVPVSHEMTKTIRLSSEISPMLRSLR